MISKKKLVAVSSILFCNLPLATWVAPAQRLQKNKKTKPFGLGEYLIYMITQGKEKVYIFFANSLIIFNVATK